MQLIVPKESASAPADVLSSNGNDEQFVHDGGALPVACTAVPDVCALRVHINFAYVFDDGFIMISSLIVSLPPAVTPENKRTTLLYFCLNFTSCWMFFLP